MKKLFPPEIITHSIETHFHRHNKKFIWIYIVSIFLVIVTLSLLPFIKVELSAQGRGIIRTPYESSPIQSAYTGQVLLNNMFEGQPVSKGDTLLILHTDQLKEQINLNKRQLKENTVFVADLKQLLKKDYLLHQQLFTDSVTPEMDFLQIKYKYDAAVLQLNVLKKQAVNTWQVEKTRLEQDNIRLHFNIAKLQKECEQYIIKAPISGTIAQTTGIHSGSFISSGQVLAQISPDEQLLAECFITPTDIGFISVDQEVRFQFDAFNYNQWGLIYGKVISVSDDITMVDNTPVFKVRCELPISYLELKSGHKGYLKKGMSLTGRFVLTERTLYQLLFDKMDDWLNPKLAENR